MQELQLRRCEGYVAGLICEAPSQPQLKPSMLQQGWMKIHICCAMHLEALRASIPWSIQVHTCQGLAVVLGQGHVQHSSAAVLRLAATSQGQTQ